MGVLRSKALIHAIFFGGGFWCNTFSADQGTCRKQLRWICISLYQDPSAISAISAGVLDLGSPTGGLFPGSGAPDLRRPAAERVAPAPAIGLVIERGWRLTLACDRARVTAAALQPSRLCGRPPVISRLNVLNRAVISSSTADLHLAARLGLLRPGACPGRGSEVRGRRSAVGQAMAED